MQRAWVVVLLAGCGFKAGTAPDGTIDASMTDGTGVMMCGRIEDKTYDVHWSGCATAALEPVHITANSVVDTSTGSSSSGPACTFIHVNASAGGNSETDDICAVLASTITIDAGVTLSAHGIRPLALFAHEIDIEGTIDVASHKTVRGPGAFTSCNLNPTLAKHAGGGAGGSFDGAGGAGGDQGGMANTGGPAEGTLTTTYPTTGCDGRRGGDGTASGGADGVGGAGGGMVWIASDMGQFKLGRAAVINASGAGGAGGTMTHPGGAGGGSGGFIVLQSSAFMRDPGSQIFANGGGGGGGAIQVMFGGDGNDPTAYDSGGVNGSGGTVAGPPVATGGDGAPGYPSASRQGKSGDTTLMAGGGGGGGGAGAIRIVSAASFGSGNVSPPAVQWAP